MAQQDTSSSNTVGRFPCCHCLLDRKGQDDFHKGLRSTWRHPVSCTKSRLRYSICSICMNQCSMEYPVEYTSTWKDSVQNGWKEPASRNRQGVSNLYYTPVNRLQEEQQKEGAVLCFGRGIINPH